MGMGWTRQGRKGASHKLIRFTEKLPDLRATMAEHLDEDELDRERVSAIALRLINLGWFRVWSERYDEKRYVFARGRRSVSRGANARGFPPPSFARCPCAGKRPRCGGAGALEPAPLLAYSAGARSRVISLDISGSVSVMARRTILVCDNCGKEVEESKGAVLRVTYSDARRGAKQADLCGECADKSPGQPAARPGRKPQCATT